MGFVSSMTSLKKSRFGHDIGVDNYWKRWNKKHRSIQ